MAMSDRSTLNSSTMNWVRKNYHELRHLPEPGELWTGSDVPYGPNRLVKFRIEGIIKREKNGQRDERYNHYYETSRVGYEVIQDYLESYDHSDRLLPCSNPECPGKGFTNLGDEWADDRPLTFESGAGLLECKDCGEIHSKEEVR